MRTAIRVVTGLLVAAWAPGAGADPTWQPSLSLSGPTWVVTVDPADARHAFAGTGMGLRTSHDGGATWTAFDRGLPKDHDRCPVTALAFAPGPLQTVYAGAGNRLSGRFPCGAFRSLRGKRFSTFGLRQESVGAIAADPAVPTTVYAGTTGDGGEFAGNLFKRTARGSFRAVLLGDDVDLDFTAIVVDPRSPGIVYASKNNEGIVKSFDSGTTWSPANTGLPAKDGSGNPAPTGFISTYALAIDPHQADTLYTSVLGLGSCCIDQTGVTGGTFHRTTNGGGSWTASTSGLTNLNVLAIVPDPVTAGVVYVGTTNGVFRSTDGGDTFAPFGGGLSDPFVLTLAITPDATKLFAGTVGSGVFELGLRERRRAPQAG